MDEKLPPRAERFLRSLTSALWALPSNEREAVALELRSHLAARSAQGEAALDEALAALGRPEDLAREFDHGRGGSLAAVPEAFAAPRRRMSVGEVVGEVRSTLRASRNGFLLAGALLVTFLTSTNFLMWTGIRVPDVGVATGAVMAVRVAAVFLALCAGYRLALSDLPAWRLGLSTLRFAGALAVATIGTMGGTLLVVRAFGAAFDAAGLSGTALLTVKAVVTLVSLAAFSCIFVRVQPWVAAQAAEREGFTLRDSWNGTAGRMGNIVRGWAAIVLPPYAAHFLLNLLALKVIAFGPATLMLAAADAAVSAVAAIAAILLNATVFRWAAGEPIPEPRPFGTEFPAEDFVEQSRARLRTLIGPAPRQPVKAE